MVGTSCIADVSGSERDGWSLLALHGEMDIYSVPLLDEEVSRVLIFQTAPRVGIDLSKLAFCDSSCLNALLRARRRINAVGGRLVLLRPSRRVSNILKRTGLIQRFEVLDALPDDTVLSG